MARITRIGNVFLANIRWVANHNVKSTANAAENLNKSNIPNKGCLLLRKQIGLCLLQFTEFFLFLDKLLLPYQHLYPHWLFLFVCNVSWQGWLLTCKSVLQGYYLFFAFLFTLLDGSDKEISLFLFYRFTCFETTVSIVVIELLFFTFERAQATLKDR